MNKIKFLLLITLAMHWHSGESQVIDSLKFFTDDKLIQMTLSTDIKKLQNKTTVESYQDALITMNLPDNTVISEKIRLHARGKSRRENCYLPPIQVDFHTPSSPRLYSLGKLKLVVGCGTSSIDEQLLLKEYLIYKMYNIIEPRSFNARLVYVNYDDSKKKTKSFSQYAFFLEDVDDMARRNKSTASKKTAFTLDEVNREKMNLVDIFEYMIGNTDWSVPANHNIRIIYPKNDENAKVFPVPYDFDNAGLVNAYYAVPNEILGTEKITDRVYRGFPRTMEEVQATLDVFRKNKDKLFALINNYELLKPQTKNEMTVYLEDFYKIISDKTQAQNIFIENARRN